MGVLAIVRTFHALSAQKLRIACVTQRKLLRTNYFDGYCIDILDDTARSTENRVLYATARKLEFRSREFFCVETIILDFETVYATGP